MFHYIQFVYFFNNFLENVNVSCYIVQKFYTIVSFKLLFMKKEKIVNYSLYSVLAVAAVFCIWGLSVRSGTLFCIGAGLVVFAAIPLGSVKTKLKEEKNPLNDKRIKDALTFCAGKRHGYKTDFIGQFGEEMYNFFTTKGFIHEPFDKENEWELTKLGLRAHIQFS